MRSCPATSQARRRQLHHRGHPGGVGRAACSQTGQSRRPLTAAPPKGYEAIEDFVILILQRGKARIARFALDLKGETDCPVNPPDFLAALRRWHPDLVTVIDAPGFAEELAAEVNRASGRDMMLLIAPMPELGEEQAPTQVGIILPDSFDSRRPKKLIGSLIQALSLNPVTKLLGTWALQAHVEQRLRTRQHFAFLYLDLDNFKAYNDMYGFAQGDAAIRTLAGTVVAAVRERGNPGDVASHIGGDDFAVLTTSDNAEAIARQIIAAFDATVPSLYSVEDRERGSITVTDRRGEIVTYPLMTVSIAGVLTSKRPVGSYRELSDIAAELKQYAKSLPGSVYVEERRRGDAESAAGQKEPTQRSGRSE